MVLHAFLRFRQPQHHQKDPGEQITPSKATAKTAARKLLHISDLPPWYEPNPYILTSYRPLSPSWRTCLASWGYTHNETGNIYSHLIPAAFLTLLLAQGWLYQHVAGKHAGYLTAFDWAVVCVQVFSGVLCLGTSAVYHTGLCHSKDVSEWWLKADYMGILGLILGNFVSGLHFGFYCRPVLKIFYWGLTATLGFFTGTIQFNPRFAGEKYRVFRLTSFIATGLSAFAPIAHACVLWGLRYVWGIGVPYYLLEGGLLMIGCWFWERRVPERLYPGRFDLWGQSHTTFHVFVTLSIAAHICGLLSAMEYTYAQAWCLSSP